MRITAFRIPTRIHLPGVVIQVRQVDATEIDGDWGRWDYDTSVSQPRIRINRELPIAVKRYVLFHELQHVLVDLVDIGLENHGVIVSTAHMSELRRKKRNSNP